MNPTASTIAPTHAGPGAHPAAATGRRVQAPRAQYLELRANVHRKLLGRLNLEALAQSDRSRAEAEIRARFGDLHPE